MLAPHQPTSCLLHPAQLRVLRGVGSGLSNKEIARVLNISDQTVKNHVTAIFQNIGVESRLAAVVVALREGWLDLADL